MMDKQAFIQLLNALPEEGNVYVEVLGIPIPVRDVDIDDVGNVIVELVDIRVW